MSSYQLFNQLVQALPYVRMGLASAAGGGADLAPDIRDSNRMVNWANNKRKRGYSDAQIRKGINDGDYNGGGTRDEPVVSKYHEDKVTYQAKANKKGTRRRKRIARLGQQLEVQQLPGNIVHFDTVSQLSYNAGAIATSAPTATQVEASYTMFGNYGTAAVNDDIFKIVSNMPVFSASSGGGGAFGSSIGNAAKGSRVLFTSAHLRLHINALAANTSSTHLDVYEYMVRGNPINAPSLDSLMTNDSAIKTTNATASPAITLYGVTPFEFPKLTTCVRILRKREMLLAPGENTILELSEKKTRQVDVAQWNAYTNVQALSNQSLNWQNWTRGYIIIARGALYDNTGVVNASGGAINLLITRTYGFKYLNNSNATQTRF